MSDARFDRIENEIDGLKSQVKEVETRLEVRIDEVEARLGSRIDEVESRLDRVDQRLAEHDLRFDRVDQKLAEHDRRFDRLELKMEVLLEESRSNLKLVLEAIQPLTRRLDELEPRVERLEVGHDVLTASVRGLLGKSGP